MINTGSPKLLHTKGALLTPWGVFLILVIAVFILGAAAFFLLKASLPQVAPYEISNFTGSPEVYSRRKRAWVPAERGAKFGPHDRIRTKDEKSEVDLRLPEQVVLRLKGNSELRGRERDVFNKDQTHRFHLLRGTVLAATLKEGSEEEKRFEISTPQLEAAVWGTIFKVEADPEKKESSIQVLRGSVKVRSEAFFNPKIVVVQSLERIERKGSGELTKPVRVTRAEWDQMKEAYELTARSAVMEAMQMDLAKQGGTLFDYVFDHGSFFTPKIGYCSRDFVRDEEGKVYLELEYDVFPTGSFVGMYMKTRGLDISGFEALEFEARRAPNERFPQAFRIELKSEGQVVRGLAAKSTEAEVFKKDWRPYRFPIRSNVSLPLTEVAFVFLNTTVGEYKKGVIQLRNINLIPSAEGPKPPAKAVPEIALKEDFLAESDTAKSSPTAPPSEKPETLEKPEGPEKQETPEKQDKTETAPPKAPASQALKVSLSQIPKKPASEET